MKALLEWGAGRASLKWAACAGSAVSLILTFLIVRARTPGEAGGAAWMIGGVLLLLAMLIPAGIYRGMPAAWSTARYLAVFNLIGVVIVVMKARSAGAAPGMETWAFSAFSAALFFVAWIGEPASRRRAAEEGSGGRGREPDPVSWSRDNIEAIVIAYLMALIIRCFCVEVFKIPTGSMEPTLYGDTRPEDLPPHHSGDRIMVDKLGLIFGGVDRYDVCVFKYPLDRSRNFIKRIVGLPGDDIMIEHQDLWVRPSGTAEPFRLARKPAREQAGIWIPVWPDGAPGPEYCKRRWDGAPAACYPGGNVFDTGPAKGEAMFRSQWAITGAYKGKGPGNRMYDLRLRFAASFTEAKGEIVVVNQRGDGYGGFAVVIGAGGRVTVRHERDREGAFEPEVPAPAPVEVGSIQPGTEIEVANFDGALRVTVAGRTALAWEYVDRLPEDLPEPNPPAFQLTFGSRDGPVRFEGVEVGRDIAYTASGDTCFSGREFLTVPKGRYLAIGDNVGNSKDSRLWKERHVRLKNGLTIVGDADTMEHYPATGGDLPDGRKRFRDLDGTDHFFREEDVEDDGTGSFVHHPFVAREELVGKALLVWWPLPRFKVIR